MKKFLILLLGICFFMKNVSANDELAGDVILQLDPEEQNGEPITLKDQINTILEAGAYFHKNYPDVFIETDLSHDVQEFFPHLTQQEVYDREQTIRDGVKIYRYFSNLYDKVKSKILAPDPPPLVVNEEDYDDGSPGEYIETDDDQVVVVTDIKKVLAYGNDRRDFEAYEAYQKKKHKESEVSDSFFDKFSRVLSEVEWKKLPFYGIIYDSPVVGQKGIGKWAVDDKDNGVKASLLAEVTTIGDKPEIRGALEIKIPRGYEIAAVSGNQKQKPQVAFVKSENLQQGISFRPVPTRFLTDDGKDRIVFLNSLVMPLIYKPADIKKTMVVRADVAFTLCKSGEECRPIYLQPELKLVAGSGFPSAVNNFIVQNFNALPQTELKNVSIDKVVADDDNHLLHIYITYDGDVGNPDIFVSVGEDVLFSRPRISVNGKRIVATLDIMDKDIKLAGRELELTIKLNKHTVLRSRYEAEEPSVLSFLSDKLSLGMLLLAVLGGFILNFMPCVFPVLSLKLLSITKFGAQREKALKKNFLLTIVGIWGAFLFLSSCLAFVKHLGYSIGWGMQFQSPVFVVVMLFVIALFGAQVNGFYQIRLPQKLQNLSHSQGNNDSFLHVMTGVLIVVMSTPCTGPYLGTTIGFALAGSVADIFAILMAVALGLSLPYILVILMPDIVIMLPKPGEWMNKLNRFMSWMLFLTMLWLFSVLWAQIDTWPCLRLALYLSLFLCVVWVKHLFTLRVESFDEPEDVKLIVLKWANRVFVGIFLLFLCGSIWDVQHEFTQKRLIDQKNTNDVIDFQRVTDELRAGNSVIVRVGANWCLTCLYNDQLVFGNISIKNLMAEYHIKLIDVDWSNYNQEVLDFMARYGRKGVPFYILFTPNIPEGMVLPEIMSEVDMRKLIRNIAR